LDGAKVPTRVLIVPWGHVESTSGDFEVDAESARLVLEAFKEHGTDLPIDYEHQTLGGRYTSPSGQAPAAGWVKQIEVEEGVGVFAEVHWTPPALEQLVAKQYRYLSPVALIRKSDRKLVALHSVALTNKPAIVNMTPIVNRTGDDKSLTATEALEMLREHLSLPTECEEVNVLVAAGLRLEKVARESAARTAQCRVTEAQRQGRLTAAQREWALNLALKDAELFDQWLATAPVVVPLGRTTPADDVQPAAVRRKAVAEAARAEFRACAELNALTSEEAYVAAALREVS
ncbi:MAG: hypothetical protein KAV82_06555, partial [Phycisphaerae bacterium]|nr:hypothetical protein [Phycisphaerae bacterium]